MYRKPLPNKSQQYVANWVWVKTKPPGDHRFESMFPFTRVPFWGLRFLTHCQLFPTAEPPISLPFALASGAAAVARAHAWPGAALARRSWRCAFVSPGFSGGLHSSRGTSR